MLALPEISYWACKLWNYWKWGGHLCRAQWETGTFLLLECWEQYQSPLVIQLFPGSPERHKRNFRGNTKKQMGLEVGKKCTGYSFRSTGSLKGSESSHWTMRSSSSLHRPLQACGLYECGRVRSWRCIGLDCIGFYIKHREESMRIKSWFASTSGLHSEDMLPCGFLWMFQVY